MQGIHGHDGIFNIKAINQLSYCLDFPAFVLSGLLAEHQPLTGIKRRHQMQAIIGPVLVDCPSYGLAIDGNDRLTSGLATGIDPGKQGVYQRFDSDASDDAGNRVTGWDGAGKRSVLAQPIELVSTEILDLLPAFATGNDSGHYQKHDIDQIMLTIDRTARVFDER